ncbi:MAG: FtsW/RodA/SpoVE family cell cycle protein [Eubacteriales bacterium]|nr:FtsW/RodA/SpoVE family cell cycle protein [Eubacteriales bacterium]
MFREKYQLKNYNWILLAVVVAVCLLGVLFINSADSSYTKKQLVGVIACVMILLFLSFVNYNYICSFSNILYGLNILILLFVKFFGVGANGARRWLNLGFTRLQPSEFSKLIMIIFVAVFIQEHEDDFNELKTLVKLAALCAIPLLLIVAEPDLSTTLDLTFILLAVIFVGGLNSKLIRTCIIIFVPLFAIFIWYIQTPNQVLLKDYQVTRIMTFINPSAYADTTAYQQENSVMAIGSGQLYGKGLNNNTISDVEVTVTDTGLVSEQQTDFIFSVVGEEVGFVGSVILIVLLAVIVIQCLIIASRAKNISGRLIATGVGALIGFQSFINIGVATQLLPNTGLPLPFVSYGLTSLLSLTAGIGIVLNVGLQRHY